MKLKLFAFAAAIMLLTSANSHAGNGYFTQLGRSMGYGISDGYHAQRYCLNAETSCGDCSPVQQPMMQQPMMQQPMMQQPMMRQPMIEPSHSQWAPPRFDAGGNPAGQLVTPAYPQRYGPYPPSSVRILPIASPARNPGPLWPWSSD